MRSASHFGTEVGALDGWLAGPFREANHAAERSGEAPRVALGEGLDRARVAASAVVDGRGPAGPEARYELLGSFGMLLAALRRHELDDDADLRVVLGAMERLGGELGVAPRYVFAHQVRPGAPDRTFTTSSAEAAFVRRNRQGVEAYARAGEELGAAAQLAPGDRAFAAAVDRGRSALDDVLAADTALTAEVDVPTFFAAVRPYFKPYDVAGRTWRGTNAGDFAGVNEVDVLLGALRPADEAYARVLAEKRPYVPPEDVGRLDAIAELPSLVDRVVGAARAAPADEAVRASGRAVLAACRAHAAAASFHHARLVGGYLVKPAAAGPPADPADLTASGPPLEEVVAWLGRLRDARCDRSRLVELRALVA